ncbi:hypothetical protein MSAN_00685100 [Mycena sanguinolenta]|uniref:RNase H type-1 domain-containing protein n=1 Tax=Mycena sanguinolenta TaxID=230812 RepID=A0A8H6Z0R5_9AGAR|nr:hypothetical protein MSAN_00685100 [Mycena sanguinolenta]
MILNDKELDTDGTPIDAPPSYEATAGTSSARPGPVLDTKRPQPIPASPLASGSSLASSSSSIAKSPAANASWFNFGSSTTKQVRVTVLGLVRDLVKLEPGDLSSSVVAMSILKSCAEACATNGLSISSILQEKSVEGHTPCKPPESPETQENSDLLTTLLSLSSPLTPATMSDVRLACLLTSDQALFQRLRSSPEFEPLSPTDEMLLDATIPPDDITVENVDGMEGAFVVDFSVVRFQKRMLVSKAVTLDFIARNRMWRLSFNVSTQERRRPGLPPPGTWYISLSLLENSPPTWIDSRLLVSAPPESAMEPPSGSGFANSLFGTGKARPRPTLSARLKAIDQLQAPRNARRDPRNRIIVPMDEGDGGLGSLQYAGCPYIASDETLRGRLEARLAKPEAECQFRAIQYDKLIRAALLQSPAVRITNLWTPAHVGTFGNELAVDATKAATRLPPPPSVPASLTASLT